MINKNELLYKINTIIDYLKDNKGYEYRLYNRLCPDNNVEPDSNIVEYAEDILYLVEQLIENKSEYEDNL